MLRLFKVTKASVHEKATFLRDAVFAANDGTITTFAIVAGSAGAEFSSRVVLILGFANLLADGLSMAGGNYLGVKSEMEYEKSESGRSDDRSPKKHSLVTLVAFALAGLIPLLPYLFGVPNTFVVSGAIVVLTLFAIGSLRSFFTKRNWLTGGLEVLVVGGSAALVAYGVGSLLDRYVV